jgi:subtilase family serine protease
VVSGLVAIAPAASAASARKPPPAPPRASPPPTASPWTLRTDDPDHDGVIDERTECAPPAHAGQAACFAVRLTNLAVFKGAAVSAFGPLGYGPSSLQHAYQLNATLGAGRTAAIVDAYDDPNAEPDLASYRNTYGLPACTTANGCFRKVSQSGGTRYPAGNAGWAGEISLDLDMVSAICPRCSILLVEASNTSITNLGAAVNEAVKLGAQYVSNSYGGSESASDTTYDRQYYNHPGVVITAATGDGGYGTAYPSTSADVVAAGGTTLTQSSGTTRGWTETAWSGTGSGCSVYDGKPAWQKDTGCTRRTAADVAAVSDPATGVAVYDTYRAGGWQVYGGTSAASPIIASVYALAGLPAAGTNPASYLYAHASSLNDITSGSNGSCSPAYLCQAQKGYDGPTGLGTPNGTAAFTATGRSPTPPPCPCRASTKTGSRPRSAQPLIRKHS